MPDVLGAGPTSTVEVEVKVSRADFRKDFDNKKAKFWMYQNAESGNYTNRIPNYLYYFVPEDLAEFGQKVLDEKFPRAGLLVYRPELKLLPGRNLEISRSAKKLHPNPPSRTFLHEVFLRTSSELCGVRSALVELRKRFDAAVKTADQIVTNAAAQHAGVLDIEAPELDLEQRCREYVAAMEPGTKWEDLPPERQEYWRQGVRRLLDCRKDVPDYWCEALSK